MTTSKDMIMRRVYLIYWWRRMMSPMIIKITLLAGVLTFEVMLVSWRSVWANLNVVGASDLVNLERYIVNSFSKTQLSVQALTLLGGVVGALLIKDAARSIRFPRISLPFGLNFK